VTLVGGPTRPIHQASRKTYVLESSQEPNFCMVSSGSHSGGSVQQLVAIQRGEALVLSFRRIGRVFRHSSSRGLGTLPPTYYVTVGTWFGLAVEGGSRQGQTSVVISIA
jgi:hypothetical protein